MCEIYRTIYHNCSRVDERRDGRCLRRRTCPIGLRGVHDPCEFDRGLGRLRVLHEECPRSLPGCVQGAGDHKQQLATCTSGKGARAKAWCMRERLQNASRRDRKLCESAPPHGRRGPILLLITCDNQSQLQVSYLHFLEKKFLDLMYNILSIKFSERKIICLLLLLYCFYNRCESFVFKDWLWILIRWNCDFN